MNLYAIINDAIKVDTEANTGYVYFLIKDSEIIYVGQTVEIDSRINSHKRDKDFDSYNFITVDCEDMDVTESLYIHAISPKLNGKLIGNGKKFKTSEKTAPLSISKLYDLLLVGQDMKRRPVK